MLHLVIEMFSYPFMVRALLVGALIALCAAVLGVTLVLKRYSMIGDGLSHVGFGALAIASAMNAAPLLVAIPVVVAAAFFLLRLRETSHVKGDSAIALISTCVSSIVTIVILFLGMFLVIPLRPFLESEIASSASNYLMAALFGCLVLAFIAPSGGKTDIKNKLWIGIIPFVLTAALAIAGVLETSAAVAMVLVAIPVCLITARILYKKGIVRVVTKE